MKDIVIIGGGLAGLVSGILLNRAGFDITILEKKQYPFHKVCGEYVSNEVKNFLINNNLYPAIHSPSKIDKFLLSSTSGATVLLPLKMGGFGISRYCFDNFLYETAKDEGVNFLLSEQANEITFDDNHFIVKTRSGIKLQCKLLIGAHGKRAKIDKNLNRSFIRHRSPFLGVKYHIKTDFRIDTVAIFNFEDGYCGLVKTEGELYNLCYLSTSANLKKYDSLEEMERSVLWKNPHLKTIWKNSEFVSEKPEAIHEISFKRKKAVENHVLMAGDSASMITPLCGNGMAMAIHSAKILSEVIKNNWKGVLNPELRKIIEDAYCRQWEAAFSTRFYVGRNIQKLYGSTLSSNLLVYLARSFPQIASYLVRLTHGKQL